MTNTKLVTDGVREALERELADLEAKNEAATSWGAAVGVRLMRIKDIRAQLRAPADVVAPAGGEREKLADELRAFITHRRENMGDTDDDMPILPITLRSWVLIESALRTASAPAVPGAVAWRHIAYLNQYELTQNRADAEKWEEWGFAVEALGVIPPSPAGAMPSREDFARAICRAYFYCDLNTPDGLAHWRKNERRCLLEADAVRALLSEPRTSVAGEREALPWNAGSNRSYEPVEQRAKLIYDAYVYNGVGSKPEWVPGGNSTKQDDARFQARRELRSEGHAPSEPTSSAQQPAVAMGRDDALAPGCCSSVNPCFHQKHSPQTICEQCLAAFRAPEAERLDAATVEACAKVADNAPAQTAGDRRRANAIADSIRALAGSAS